ncbi:MazG-like family protein [Pseudomonas putida]|uniref:MazG-like family protein n=1 Tax=Pseudomonas putida TaxID=303 RepID=UPI003F764950
MGQFHSPKRLVMALRGEVGELIEIFQWLSEDASKSAAYHPETAQSVEEELADMLMYLMRLASLLGVDQRVTLSALAVEKRSEHSLMHKEHKLRNTLSPPSFAAMAREVI